MSIKGEVQAILLENLQREESRGRVKSYAKELNKLNPIEIGAELVGNAWTHYGKPILIDRVYIGSCSEKNLEFTGEGEARYFIGEGYVNKKDGSLSNYRSTSKIEISEYLDE